MAFTAMLPVESGASASHFLRQAVAYFAHMHIAVRRVMTDNRPCVCSDRFAESFRELQIKHIRTRIYTSRTNGKAERFIQTAIHEWACARLCQNSAERLAQLAPRIDSYIWHRPHASLNQYPPISRSGLDVNNPLRHHTKRASLRSDDFV
jgi:transposase InsO family protein